MQIEVNGESRTLAQPTSLADLLEQAGLAQKRVAIELNGEIVPRSLHATRALKEGDRIEIVHALGGG